MLRTSAGVLTGLVTWLVAVTAIGFVAGTLWPELAAAGRNPPTLTLAMLATRLSISFVASVVSGAVASLIGRDGVRAALGAGLVLLAWWSVYHVTVIWHLFPV